MTEKLSSRTKSINTTNFWITLLLSAFTKANLVSCTVACILLLIASNDMCQLRHHNRITFYFDYILLVFSLHRSLHDMTAFQEAGKFVYITGETGNSRQQKRCSISPNKHVWNRIEMSDKIC